MNEVDLFLRRARGRVLGLAPNIEAKEMGLIDPARPAGRPRAAFPTIKERK